MVNQDDPRVLRTRQLIREAFSDLLQKKGFDSITVKDIAQKASINRATFYAHYEDKYDLLEEITEQAFHKMYPEEVMNANEFTDEICSQLIILTYNYIVTFYKTCGWDSKSIGTIVDEKIKKMLQETIGNIFLKDKTFRIEDDINTKIISAMTCSAIYGAAYSWFRDGKNNQIDVLLAIVRPYIMNSFNIYRNIDE
ncbi:TetR/AcrR family transcriptional regulator [Clostridium beijerinckii]|uniref:TetR family transcriptional regulator n=1 Tax=Clostridium beijerinckii TaxID=1520 RepID=A0A1S9N6I3_CLOBE|nr:TetR/AcrR family transcriptional regulator [Clostridium beijerinckii]MZK50928.1 TetR family transcriptional regulator [Clostridium beijerinckii]MZK59130.1 TetR family transcriptional regulator [Clostridium beijerinckii]MZK69249.1 TetR family transcriptional regulator [Clostridium beijerinckii]MZK74621.1 TetR family transcriptional regulator [Clostridium beijerinckii]MZK84341.1 TetR family transcriptional regulator [Clostridium beijerinckii]